MYSIFDLIDTHTWDVKWDVVESIPEFKALENTPHHSFYHKEGNPLNHTKLVCEETKKMILSKGSGLKGQLFSIILLGAALFHDIGKSVRTMLDEEKKDYSAPGHGNAGEIITRKILWDTNIIIREHICSLVKYHMRPYHFVDGWKYNEPDESPENTKKIHKMVETAYSVGFNGVYSLDLLMKLNRCDNYGSIHDEDDYEKRYAKIMELIEKYNLSWVCYDEDMKCENSIHQYFNDRTLLLPREEKECVEEFDTTLYLMMGIPGSGKSTLSEKMIKENPSLKHLSRDVIRKEIGITTGVGNKEEEAKVSSIFDARLKKYAMEGVEGIIIDNTNLSKFAREKIHNTLDGEFNVRYEYIYVEAPSLSVNFERRPEEVWKSVISRMQNTFDWPTRNEFHSFKVIKQQYFEVDNSVEELEYNY